MKSYKFVFLRVLFVFLAIVLLNGCSSQQSNGVQFNNEVQLEQEGFISKINQVVYLGNEKIIIEKVAFDRNSMTFVYQDKNIQLPVSAIVINGIEGGTSQKLLEHMDESTTYFSTTVTGNYYHTVTVPYNLKLTNQTISIEINYNGKNNKFDINFPGEKIAFATADVMFDSSGKVIDEGVKAVDRVIVGIGCTIIQSKRDNEFIIFDKEQKKVLCQSHKSSTIGETSTLFDPVSLPRKQIEIKILPEEKMVLISSK